LYRKAKTSNPLFYFGSVGLVSTLSGLGMAAFVVYRWFVDNVGHEIVAVGATAAILFGVQLLMFGVLADLILSLHREQLTRIDRLESESESDGRNRETVRTTEPTDGESPTPSTPEAAKRE
ncbi:MAG: TIGR04182 family glycosyltransferase, partial [Halohasta sp.]